MSGGISATTIAGLAAAAVTAGAGIYASNEQSRSARNALNAQKEQNAALAANKPQETKAPGQGVTDTAGVGTGTNAMGAGNFNSNTLLTGAQGVTDPLNLSKNKLAGGALGGVNTLLGA